MITNILWTLLFNNVLFFVENKRGLKVPKSIVYVWGIISMMLTSILMLISHSQLSLPSILITGIIGTIINLTVWENLKLQRVFTKSLLTIFLFFFSSIFQIIPILIFQINIEHASLLTESYLSLFSQICFICCIMVIYYQELKEELQIFLKDKMKNLDTGFKCWFLGFVVMIVSNLLIAFLLPKAIAGNEESVQEMIKVSPWISLIGTGLFAPFVEEITFRKAFRNMISNDKLFILISGIIFGGLHVVLSLNSYYDLAYLIPYCSLGIAFGFAYVKTKNVFTSFVMHALHNTALTLISIASSLVILC